MQGNSGCKELELEIKKIREERDALSRIIDDTPHGIALLDRKGNYLRINSYFTQLTGYRLSDIPNKKKWFEKAYPDKNYRNQISQVWNRDCNKPGMGETREFKIRCKNGQSKLIEFRSTFSEDQTITVLTDVTQRSKAEDALKESEERLKAIFGANPDPVTVYNAEGHPLYLNNAFIDVFGWTLEELMGKRIPFVPEDQKKLENQLQHAQKMIAIGTLAGGIAHDFNNILFPVLGHTEILLMDTPEDSPAKNRLQKIYKGAQRAKNLVKQILTFSRQGDIEFQTVKLQPVIKEAISFMRATIPDRIEIEYLLDDNCSDVKADPTQIHQIIMNLMTNSSHAMEAGGGKIQVNLKEVKFEKNDVITPAMEPGTYICLTVADKGKGIEEKFINQIFDPFFTTKEKGRGTGIGLATVHGIVKKMSGEIQVFSNPGKGAVFNIYFPAVISHKVTDPRYI